MLFFALAGLLGAFGATQDGAKDMDLIHGLRKKAIVVRSLFNPLT